MCKYVVIIQDGKEVIHTECGYLLNKKYTEMKLANRQTRCMFCCEEIEYVSQED